MILYRNTKVKVRSPDGDTEYFDIVAGVLQGDTLAPYLFIICLDYVLRTSIDKIRENGFELTKKRSRRYPAKTITDADYADDIAILANTPDQAETLLHSLERAATSIGLYANAHKTEYMCYNQTGDISTLEGTPLKLVDKFTYLGSSVVNITVGYLMPNVEEQLWYYLIKSFVGGRYKGCHTFLKKCPKENVHVRLSEGRKLDKFYISVVDKRIEKLPMTFTRPIAAI